MPTTCSTLSNVRQHTAFAPSAPLAFIPVAVKPRADGWTPERQRDFVAALARIGSVSAAAAAVGKSAKTAYALRQRSDAASFAAAWDHAVACGLDHARDHAIERALHGVAQPVFYRGLQVGERRVYNDRLLIAALRRRLDLSDIDGIYY